MSNSDRNKTTGTVTFACGVLFAGVATFSNVAVQAQVDVVDGPRVGRPVDITEIAPGKDKVLCIRSRSLATDQDGKRLQVLFEWSDDPTCRVLAVAIDPGMGQDLVVFPRGVCPPNSNLPTGTGQPVFVGLNPPLAPGHEERRCIADSHGPFWTTEQMIIATIKCDNDDMPELRGGRFRYQYDITTTEPLHVSEALVGACAPPMQYEPAPLPACNDGVDNDKDGAVDFPEDGDCAGPDDDDEGPEQVCLPSLGRNVKRQFYTELATVQRAELGLKLQQRVSETIDAKLRIIRYLRCSNEKALDLDPENRFRAKICLQEPIWQGVPNVCPPLDCPVDGPGCMAPYPYRRAQVPDEAVAWTALWGAGFIEQPILDLELSRLIEKGEIHLDATPPKKLRHLPHLGLGVGLGLVLLLIGLGVMLGRRNSDRGA